VTHGQFRRVSKKEEERSKRQLGGSSEKKEKRKKMDLSRAKKQKWRFTLRKKEGWLVEKRNCPVRQGEHPGIQRDKRIPYPGRKLRDRG